MQKSKQYYSKNSDIWKIAVIILKFEQSGFTVMCPKDADGIANSLDPDQTAPIGAV